jgi:hypothetical protein
MTTGISQPTVGHGLMFKILGSDPYELFSPEFSEDLQGWNSYAPIFSEIIDKINPIVIVEVGVWKGASAIHFAKRLREKNIDGAVIAIDGFLGSFDPPYNAMIPRKYGRSMIYEQFLSNIIHNGLQQYIVPMPQLSSFAIHTLKRLGIISDMIHIDAGHDYDSVYHDIASYWDILRDGGYLIADDYHPSWPGVVEAVKTFSAERQLAIADHSPKAVLHKTSSAR